MRLFKFGKNEKFEVPEIGLGTWTIGGTFTADHSADASAVKSIQRAFDMGYSFVDTAEMYGAGHTEEIVGMALRGRKVTVATKVWQTNLHYDDVLSAARRSIERLGVNCIDLYQIHWPNDSIPLRETMKAMEKLVDDGLVRHIGVSNFDEELLEDAAGYLSHREIVSDQVKFSLIDREPLNGLLDYCRDNHIGIIAYEPLSRGKVLSGATGKVLASIARRKGMTPVQIALNWLISKGAMPIPKSTSPEHLLENLQAAGWRLSGEDVQKLDNIQ